MPPRDWRLLIKDILESITKIRRYTAGTTFESFSSDEKTVDAVVRNIGIIGEAARHIPQHIEEQYPDVPWSEMRGIRNVVIHLYFGVDLPILWTTVQHNLPPLVSRLQEILDIEAK
ncbi:MAG: DUF86 domain-containing protein [Chloroflexi bacterium]|nr:DUF86 domain-containing protein [Chloroflexota bacterium]